MLLGRKRVFQHAGLQKLEACPYPAAIGIFPLKIANFSSVLSDSHFGAYARASRLGAAIFLAKRSDLDGRA